MAVVVAVPLLVWAAWPSGATASFAVQRFGGPDRYDTSRQVAEAAFPAGSDTVLLANGLNYPDALAGAYLAGTKGIPILLTDPQSLSAAATQAFHELKVKHVTVLGGPLAVSDNVVNQVNGTASTSSAGGNIVATRLAGPTRYETAAAIATSGGTVGTYNGQPAALVASGANFPDALSAGPASFSAHLPILLTDPNTESPQTEAALTQLGIKQVILLGGTNAVSAGVATSLASNGSRTVTRIGGVDRTDTAAQFYEQVGLKSLGFTNQSIFLANGITFPAPDALAGSPLAGHAPTAILLTEDANNLGQFTGPEIQAHASTLTNGTILGGTLAISASAQSAFIQAAGGASNTNGPITLDRTTVSPGGTINGTVANPTTVSSLTANGCGISNQKLTVSTGGAFSLVIPASQPPGACSLTFTVVHNDGTPTATPNFLINVVFSTLQFNAPTLVSVAVTRNQPPTAFDSATFTFNQPLAATQPDPTKFEIYRASGALARGIGAPSPSGASAWTVSFPPGTAMNAALGGVLPGAVANTSGEPNFPGSVATSGSGPAITTLEPDLTSVSAPAADPSNTFFTEAFSFDKTFLTTPAPVPQQKPLTSTSGNGIALNSWNVVVPGTTLAGTLTNPAGVTMTATGCGLTAQPISVDGSGNFSVGIPVGAIPTTPNDPRSTPRNCTLTFNETVGGQAKSDAVTVTLGYVTCMPWNPQGVPQPAQWQTAGATGQSITAASTMGLTFNPIIVTSIADTGTCNPANAATVTFNADTAAHLGIVEGAVQEGSVFNATTDHVGNPLSSAFVPTNITSNWPILDRVVENGPSSTSTTSVTYFFRHGLASRTFTAAQAGSIFKLILGDGNEVPATAAAMGSGSPPTFIVVSFPSLPGVADAVGAIAQNPGTCTGANTSGCAIFSNSATTTQSFSDSSAPLSASAGSAGGQVVTPQLVKVDMTTSPLNNSVVFTFDQSIANSPLPSFFLYTTNGSQTAASGSPSVSGNTATFSCLLGSSCSTGWDTSVITAAVAGGVWDTTTHDPAASPPAAVQATINGGLAGTTTTTSTSTTSTTA